MWGFPCSSVGKESACNARDPGLIPGLGRSAGEGIGYPLQYSWTSLVAQLVKNPPAMWETWVRSLDREDPLVKGKATLQYSGLENSMNCIVHGIAKSGTQLSKLHFLSSTKYVHNPQAKNYKTLMNKVKENLDNEELSKLLNWKTQYW